MGTIRVGLIGAGYIAGWHAAALREVPGVRLVAVADPAPGAAAALAGAHGAAAFDGLGALIAARACDAVHILTPPEFHAALAFEALGAGLHAWVEKPVALARAEAEAMAAAAAAAGRHLGAGHNFLGLPAHARLRALLAAGALGRVSSAEVHWCLPFAPLRSGPFTIWPLRAPANLVRELAPHPLAFVHDLFGPAEVLAVVPGHPVTLPGGAIRHQSLRALLRAGGVEVSVILSTVEVTDERAVSVRGSSGRARLDYAADTLVHDGENSAELVLNPALRQAGLAWAHLREGAVNAARQGLSLNRRSAYAQGFIGAFGAFYGAIAEGGPPDPRFAPAAAVAVTDLLDRVVAGLPDAGAETRAAPAPAPAAARAPVPDTMVPDTMVPDTMVIGGTGFIGAALTRALVARGHAVRVLSRGTRSPFPDLPGRVEVVAAPQDDAAALARAMDGCRTIFHLGRALETTWEGALKNDVGVTETIARAALAAGVGRLVYTGTIASHAMADPGRTITDDTPLPDDMGARNLYARSKAECERRLLALHRAEGLPLVIARPGIVVGPGGPLQHWGIGRWHGAGAVRLWGAGRNPLPFVLIDDVVAGLIACADVAGIEGRAFNLVGPPLLSARDWFEGLHARTGARLRVRGGNLTAMWAAEAAKWALKRHVLGRRGAVRASRADWLSRGHFARFDTAGARAALGWAPEADRARFLDRAIDARALFGL